MSATLQASSGWRRFVTFLTSDSRILVTCLVLLLAHAPLFLLHLHSVSEWSDYQFFPYAILAALFLAVNALAATDWEQPRRPRYIACYFFLTLSWLMLAFGLFVISSPRAGALAFVSTIVAVTLAFGQTDLLKRLLPALVIFCMIIPLPWNLDQLAVSSLQSLTSRQSGQALDWLGIPNIVQAHSVKLPGTTLQVEEGCSGINSLFTILITAILYVCWMKRPMLRSGLLLAAAIASMMLANVLRVVAVGVLAEQFGKDWSTGWRHEVLGLFFFGIALLLVGSMDQFLVWAAHVTSGLRAGWLKMYVSQLCPKKKPAPSALESEPTPVGLAPCFGIPVAVAFGFLVIAQAAWLVPAKSDARFDSDLVERAQALPFEPLVAAGPDWEENGIERIVRERTSPFGKYSVVASFKFEDHDAKLEIDYPFFGWHNLTNCYALRGWDVRSSRIEETKLPDQQPGDTVVETLTKGIDGHAYLLYGMHDSSGRILKRPGKYPGPRWLQAHLLSPRGLNVHLCSLFHMDIGEQQTFSAEPEWFMPTMQLQLFVLGPRPLDEKRMDQANSYFDKARMLLLQELSQPLENKP